MSNFGRLLVIIGLSIAAFGGLIWLLAAILPLGRLPGDIVWRQGRFTFFFPLASSILISLLVTFLLNLIFRFFR
ncbi:MAG: DUF2905 domain-containing protein [Firmicutes bacterium]|nr:DUF2905 domain-containing protein [Bacillota bacterium]